MHSCRLGQQTALYTPLPLAAGSPGSSSSRSCSQAQPAASGSTSGQCAPPPRYPSPDERDRLVALGCALLTVWAHKEVQPGALAADWCQLGLRPLVERESLLQSFSRYAKRTAQVSKVRVQLAYAWMILFPILRVLYTCKSS